VIVGYCRLSRDEDTGEMNTSIEAQQEIIRRYAKDNNLVLDKMYIDDNYSGYVVTSYDDTVYERPDFLSLYEYVKNGKIEKIIVKDSSRFGRNGSVSEIILKRFKKYGCTCIDISGNDLLNDFTAIYGFVNEMAVKEASRKVRLTFAEKQKSGKLLMGNSYFGYFRVNKIKLIINPEEATVIKLIFDMYLNGNGYSKIANYLNDNGYLTPSGHFNKQKQDKGIIHKVTISEKWQPAHLARILGNDLYCGILTTHKNYVDGIKGKMKSYSKDQWYKHADHHEAIINKDDFDLVQDIRKKRNKNYRVKKNEYLFSGFCECGQCGASVSGILSIKFKQKTKGYNCVEYAKFGTKGCSNKHVYEFFIIDSLKTYLVDVREKYHDFLSNIIIEKKENDILKTLNNYRKQLKKYESDYRATQIRKIGELNEKEESLHEIILTQYKNIENDYLRNIQKLQNNIKELEKSELINIEEKIKSCIDIIDQILSSKEIKRSFLEKIIDKIVFNEDRTFRFYLKLDILLENTSMIFPAPAYKVYHRKILE
jgi:site-specific DNA recombinase